MSGAGAHGEAAGAAPCPAPRCRGPAGGRGARPGPGGAARVTEAACCRGEGARALSLRGVQALLKNIHCLRVCFFVLFQLDFKWVFLIIFRLEIRGFLFRYSPDKGPFCPAQ